LFNRKPSVDEPLMAVKAFVAPFELAAFVTTVGAPLVALVYTCLLLPLLSIHVLEAAS